MSAASRSLRPLPLLGLALTCAAGVAVTYAVLVRTRHGQRIDQGAYDGRVLASGHAHAAADQLLTTISVGTLALATGALVLQALARRRIPLAAVAGSVIGGALVTTEVLKHTLSRPGLLPHTGHEFQNTFPSGHSTIAFGVGVAATMVAPPRLRMLVATLAVAYGAAVGIAVVAAGWHRPSDVGGAFLVVTGTAAVVALVSEAVDRRTFSNRPRAWPRAAFTGGAAFLGVGLLATGFVAAVAIAAASRAGRIHWTLVDGAFVGACAAIAGLAALLMALLLWALRSALPSAAAPESPTLVRHS